MASISVCICTFRRPGQLAKTLESINRLNPGDPVVDVVVVDNDVHQSAREAVSTFRDSGMPLTYLVEPIQNIAIARNRSVHESAGEYLAFLDDDEEAHPDWLRNLYRECSTAGVDGAFGPVIPRIERGAPAWITDGGFFDRPRLATGVAVPWYRARTGNALLRRAPLLAQPGPFDESFGHLGGEDTDLFRRMIASGAKFVAADDAVVYEHIPRSRARTGYLVSRWYRIGIILARFELPERSAAGRLWYLCRSFYRALTRFAWGLFLYPVSRIESLRSGLLPAARATGHLSHIILGRLPGWGYSRYPNQA